MSQITIFVDRAELPVAAGGDWVVLLHSDTATAKGRVKHSDFRKWLEGSIRILDQWEMEQRRNAPLVLRE